MQFSFNPEAAPFAPGHDAERKDSKPRASQPRRAAKPAVDLSSFPSINGKGGAAETLFCTVALKRVSISLPRRAHAPTELETYCKLFRMAYKVFNVVCMPGCALVGEQNCPSRRPISDGKRHIHSKPQGSTEQN